MNLLKFLLTRKAFNKIGFQKPYKHVCLCYLEVGEKNMELISLKQVSRESKVLLLKELGYGSDGRFVLDGSGNRVLDRYLEIPVEVDNMAILPGSVIVLDNNELSISKFIEEFGDVF